ncbi:MAG: sterol desaturase family protein, partial [Leptospiraceae bacterium]|nr:sterol desaturase family protein [Leptospiraceae bacterium]
MFPLEKLLNFDFLSQIFALLLFLFLWQLEKWKPYYKFSNKKSHGKLNVSFSVLALLIQFPISLYTLSYLESIQFQFQGLRGQINNVYIYSIIAFLGFDMWMYFWHRLNHEFSFFWKFHSVHHSDPEMDVTSAYRFHFGELIFSDLLRIPILLLLGFSKTELLYYNAFLGINILIHHSNIAFPEKIDKFYRVFLASPEMHKVHHSEVIKEANTNYGSLLSIWDRLFHTFHLT